LDLPLFSRYAERTMRIHAILFQIDSPSDKYIIAWLDDDGKPSRMMEFTEPIDIHQPAL